MGPVCEPRSYTSVSITRHKQQSPVFKSAWCCCTGGGLPSLRLVATEARNLCCVRVSHAGPQRIQGRPRGESRPQGTLSGALLLYFAAFEKGAK